MRTKPSEFEELKKENERLQKELELAKLRKENRDLRKQIRELDNDASTITYVPSPNTDWSKYTWTYAPDKNTNVVLCSNDRWMLEDFKDMLLKD